MIVKFCSFILPCVVSLSISSLAPSRLFAQEDLSLNNLYTIIESDDTADLDQSLELLSEEERTELLTSPLDESGNNALLLATSLEYTTTAKMLLEIEPLLLNSHNFIDETALTIAIETNNQDLIDYLIEASINLNTHTQGNSPLHIALINDDEELVSLKKLLEAGADIDITNNFGQTVLMQAIIDHNSEAVDLLLDYNANINFISPFDGATPLQLALYANYYDLAQVLLDRGANIDEIVDSKANYSILCVAVLQNDEELVKFCLQNGADPQYTDYRGYSVYQYAQSRPNLKQIMTQFFPE